ncbi:MAG: hypothetical protein ACR2PG_07850 [Hyphomicrobiaceae bacterium]
MSSRAQDCEIVHLTFEVPNDDVSAYAMAIDLVGGLLEKGIIAEPTHLHAAVEHLASALVCRRIADTDLRTAIATLMDRAGTHDTVVRRDELPDRDFSLWSQRTPEGVHFKILPGGEVP